MNIFDIIVIMVLSFCLIRGLFKGLIGEISGIVGVVAGFYGAYTYYPQVSIYVQKWIHSPALRNVIVFFALFCLILVAVGLVAAVIRKFLNLVFLGWADRTFGMLFGAAKGLLISSVLFITITTFMPKYTKIISESTLSPYLAEISKALTVFVSKNVKKDFLDSLEGIHKIWEK